MDIASGFWAQQRDRKARCTPTQPETPAHTLYDKGCIGVTQCLLRKAIFNSPGLGQCYATELEAVAAAKAKKCEGVGSSGCVFALRYTPPVGDGPPTKAEDGSFPVNREHVSKSVTVFDFAYRQRDGSLIGASIAHTDNTVMLIKHYASSDAFISDMGQKEVVRYCVTCCTCQR